MCFLVPAANRLHLKLCVQPGDGVEFTAADEQNQLNAIEAFIARGFKADIWWIDAGWYPCKNSDGTVDWHVTGNWFPDPERFPNGLGPIGKLCEKNGIEFLLWFEPERVWINNESIIPKEYVLYVNPRPEKGKESKNGLFWLGCDAAREWLTAHVDRLIKDNHIKIYRQDFNFDPLKYWRGNDAPEREGMNENLHVQGYLRYYDELLDKNPGLWIDSCASGGRRNDLETMRRAVPLHPTDYGYGNHPVKQAFYNALYSWIPYFRGFTYSCDDENGDYPEKNKTLHPVDNFCLHNAFAPVAGAAVSSNSSDAALGYLKLYEPIRKRAAKYILNGDFYALTPVNKNSGDWYAVQFHDEESGSGVVEAIRNVKCEESSIILRLRALDSDINYIFESPEFGKTVEISGRELEKNGFTVSLPKRTGETWFYRSIV
jgi:alpha-galactosidase